MPSVEPRLPAWWLEQALAAEGGTGPAPVLAGEATADVAIVGGGYTGLWTALALRERDPEVRVTLLEAEICGAGPSGRNGGFLHGYWASLASVRSVLGDDDAVTLARAAEAIVPGVRAFSEQRGEDVRLREAGMLMVSAAPAQDAAVDARCRGRGGRRASRRGRPAVTRRGGGPLRVAGVPPRRLLPRRRDRRAGAPRACTAAGGASTRVSRCTSARL